MSQASLFAQFLLFGRSAAEQSPHQRAPRDARIDIVRGLALLVIFINHMPGHIVAGYMPHNFGFSDAADVFVLLAGLSAVLAYGPVIDREGLRAGFVKVAARLRTLYVAHVAVFLLVCGIVAAAVAGTDNPLYIEAINIQPLFANVPKGLLNALTLTYQPFYLDILPLYIVLLALLPLLYVGVRFSPVLTLLASAAIWQGAVRYGINLPNAGAASWFFNPFAWQFLFTIGVVMGRMAQLGLRAPRLWLVDMAAMTFVLAAVLIKTSTGNPFGIAALTDWIENIQLGTDKTNLAFERVLHVVALAWLATRYLPSGSAMVTFQAGRLLAAIGRNSLEVFCLGVVLSITGQIILAETSFAIGPQLLVCISGVIMLSGLGVFLTWYQSLSHRGVAKTSSPARALSQPASLSGSLS